MEIRGVTSLQLARAAQIAKVRVEPGGRWDVRRFGDVLAPFGHTRDGRPKVRVVLRTVRDSKGVVVWGRRGFSRNKDGQRRRIPGPVCWHGHREFMRALLTLQPDAVIITGVARYNGLAHFEATHGETGERNIGSQYDPLAMVDACDCGEVDSAA